MENTEMVMTIPEGSWYTKKEHPEGGYIITGYNNGDRKFQKGDQVFLGPPQNPIEYRVSEISFRDHAGTFKDPANKINSHYTARIVQA